MRTRIPAMLALLLPVVACGPNYSNGSRVGVINKFSNKGMLCKTWEGEMNLRGYREETDSHGNSSVVANVWKFTVPDGPLVEQASDAMEAGKRVKVAYRQWWMAPPCQSESDYIVQSIEVLP